jgi:hypothetical protein
MAIIDSELQYLNGIVAAATQYRLKSPGTKKTFACGGKAHAAKCFV